MSVDETDATRVSTDDPVAALLIEGRASTLEQAQQMYLDEHLHELVSLVESPVSDAEFRRLPLVELLMALGSRRWEDSLT
jgi:hypothetical protein